MPQTKSPNGQVIDFSGYRLPPVYEWVECEIPDVNEGLPEPLTIQVLINPTRGEIVTLSQQLEQVFQRARKRLEQQLKDLEGGTSSAASVDIDVERADDLAIGDIIAPRVTGWNVKALSGDGAELVDVPAPGQKGGNEHFPMADDAIPGGGVMELLSQRQKTWVMRIVQNAHLGGETRSKLSRRPAATDDTPAERTPSGPQIVSTPNGENRPRRRKRS